MKRLWYFLAVMTLGSPTIAFGQGTGQWFQDFNRQTLWFHNQAREVLRENENRAAPARATPEYFGSIAVKKIYLKID